VAPLGAFEQASRRRCVQDREQVIGADRPPRLLEAEPRRRRQPLERLERYHVPNVVSHLVEPRQRFLLEDESAWCAVAQDVLDRAGR
jgi:hypothetical protein